MDSNYKSQRSQQNRASWTAHSDDRHLPRTTITHPTSSPHERHRSPWKEYPTGFANAASSCGKKSSPSFTSSERFHFRSEYQGTVEPISRKIAPLASTSMDTFSCLKIASQVSLKPSSSFSPERSTGSSDPPQLVEQELTSGSKPNAGNRDYINHNGNKEPYLHSESISPAWSPAPGRCTSAHIGRSFVTSNSVTLGDEVVGMVDDCSKSYFEDDETTYLEEIASIATDPNVIAIGIPAEAPLIDLQVQREEAITSHVIANHIAENHSLVIQNQGRPMVERRILSSRKTDDKAKRSPILSSFKMNLEPQRSFIHTLQAVTDQKPSELPTDLPPTRPFSSRSVDSDESQEFQITPRMRGRKSAYLDRQHKVHTARVSMTRLTPPPKSHSVASSSPPTLPIRRKSGSYPALTDDHSVDAQTDSGETTKLPSSACSVVTDSSGIDLDDNMRNKIISRSSSMIMARRYNSSLAMEGKSSSSMGPILSKKSVIPLPEDIKGIARSRSTSSSSSHSQRSRRSDKAALRCTSNGTLREKGKHSLLLLANDQERRQGETNNGLPFRPVLTSDISAEDEETTGLSTDLEAQAGIPVVLPGAFAVRPISASGQIGLSPSGYDSDFEDNTIVSVDNVQQIHVEPPSVIHPEEAAGLRPVVSSSPVEAELYQIDYADAQVVTADSEKPMRKRVRCLLACIVLLILIITTGITVGVLYSGDDGHKDCEQGCIPTVRGWKQVGDIMMGPTNSDSIQFGHSVAISRDGQRVAIGLPGLDGRGEDKEISSQAGSVFIMDFNGTDWTLVAQLNGFEAGGNAGTAVVMSQDGKRVAFGAPNTRSGGYVVMYQEELVGTWKIVGDVLGGLGLNISSSFGSSLSLSADGRILAVGDRYADSKGSLTNTGSIHVYQQGNFTWEKLGKEIQGQGSNELFGWSIALSQDGMRVAASAVGADNLKGKVRVFDFQNDNWMQVGSSLSGATDRETFGASLALNKNGDIIAIGATGYSHGGSGVGRVRVYEFDALSKDWRSMSDPIVGDTQFDRFGYSVALSANGDTLAIGSPENDVFGMNAGFLRIMRYDGAKWISVGSKLGRQDSKGGLFGSSIAISTDGRTVVGGAPELTHDGKLSKVGRVWAYKREDAVG